MSLDKATVARIAHLARLRLGEDDQARMVGELNAILGWVEQLNAVDTDGMAPMASVFGDSLRQRQDQVTDGGYPDRVLAGGPEVASGFFVVPKVVE